LKVIAIQTKYYEILDEKANFYFFHTRLYNLYKLIEVMVTAMHSGRSDSDSNFYIMDIPVYA